MAFENPMTYNNERGSMNFKNTFNHITEREMVDKNVVYRPYNSIRGYIYLRSL